MGANDKVMELTSEGFQIEKVGNDYKVSFPKQKADVYENYICNNLKEGYWNEYIGDIIVFIFKFEEGITKKFILDESNYNVILNMCSEFAQTEFYSIEDMLLGNDFYRANVKI
jgi:hypothetical protein